MADFRYLIVGGGMTADAAVQGIRLTDGRGTIGIISEEQDPPYNRPPLSKALWKGEPVETIWRETSGKNVELFLSRRAESIDPAKKRVYMRGGESLSYDRLLLATGGRPRRLNGDPPGVVYFRTLDDYRTLRGMAATGNSFAVIGGGFIGSEISAALAMNGKAVTMILPEETIGARVYPPSLGRHLNEYFRSKGVHLLTGDSVREVSRRGKRYLLRTSADAELEVDGVVAGIGILPNVEIAATAGIAVDNGIRVDEHLKTSHADIFAAGDVASFYSPALERFVRVEHEDNANSMGLAAGKNMAGDPAPYRHLPFFYSDLFDLGYEAVGELDAGLEMVEDWKEKFREGVVYYLKEGRVRGVLLLNTWGKVDSARALITERTPHLARDLAGAIRG